jgi:hypothetical protein
MISPTVLIGIGKAARSRGVDMSTTRTDADLRPQKRHIKASYNSIVVYRPHPQVLKQSAIQAFNAIKVHQQLLASLI